MTKRILLLLLLPATLLSCTSPREAARTESEPPFSVVDTVDFSTLLEPPEEWHHYSETYTRFRGVGSRLAYETLLKGRNPQKEIVVAVIDGGVDIDHEDLSGNIWVNEDEIAGNGKDDDGNGYTDDVHGWNFIGGADGENVNHDTFELTRIYSRLRQRFADADTTVLSEEAMNEYERFRQIRKAYENRVRELSTQYNNLQSFGQSLEQAKQILQEHFSDSSYTYEDLRNMQPAGQQQQFAQNVMLYALENDIDSTLIADQKEQVYEFAKYGYNPDFSPRHIVGDDYGDKTERYYGNNDVAGPDASHGTHVAGIVAALRGNGKGIDGIAVNTKIMAIRAVPDGDERDKDVANAIRYAVDNGADIINMSFGKSYSPYKEVVDQAVRHAMEQGVLLVHGAGNDAKNTDEEASFPTDTYEDGGQAELWLTVGASSWKPGREFAAAFSNYGDRSVDLFAPGVDIYSTLPENEYGFQDGTSMASPVVAGVAALIMAYHPGLSPQQLRQLIMEHTEKYPRQHVTLPNQNGKEKPLVSFDSLSVSDGVVNVYRALKAASGRK